MIEMTAEEVNCSGG